MNRHALDCDKHGFLVLEAGTGGDVPCPYCRIDQLETILQTAFDAIESLDIFALGVVPEVTEPHAYPIRDELLYNIGSALRHRLKTEDDDG